MTRLDERCREIGYNTYDAYLLSDHWQGVKVGYRGSWRCWICGTLNETILHHISYHYLGEELEHDCLLPLCPEHHRGLHGYMRAKRVKLSGAHFAYRGHLKKRRAHKRNPIEKRFQPTQRREALRTGSRQVPEAPVTARFVDPKELR